MTLRSLAAIGLLLTAPVGAQTLHTGHLADGDDRLDGGEFVDAYEVALQAGQHVEADLTSSDFDPYLILRAPSGAQEDNDDHLGSTTRARIGTTAAETGTYTVAVTSYAAGETGAYRLTITTGPAGGPVAGEPPSGPSPRGPAARADLAGHWVGGSPAATQHRDRDTGAAAPTNGIGTTLDLGADGTYRQSRVMTQTTTGCTSTVHVDERGTYAVEGGELVLRRQSGRSWGRVCGGAPYERALEPETARFAVTVGPGRGGVATLTRSQDGEVFDELQRGG